VKYNLRESATVTDSSQFHISVGGFVTVIWYTWSNDMDTFRCLYY